MPYSPKFRRRPAAFFLIFLLLSSPLCSQEAPSIYDNLDKLENLLLDTLTNSEQQSRQLEDLNTTLAENEQILQEREQLLADLRTQLTSMSETFQKQSELYAKSERRSQFWKTFTLVGIPVAVVISAGVVAGILLAVRLWKGCCSAHRSGLTCWCGCCKINIWILLKYR
jgi:recombinational DNA repair ATPase RecF